MAGLAHESNNENTTDYNAFMMGELTKRKDRGRSETKEETTDVMILGKIWELMKRIKNSLRRHPNLNLREYLTSLDRTESQRINEDDFLMTFGRTYREVFGLSLIDVKKLAEYFRAADGRILYQQLLKIVEDDLGLPDRVKNPTVTGQEFTNFDARGCLGPKDSQKFDLLMNQIAAQAIRKNISLKAQLADYEAVSKNSGLMTVAHFGNLLYNNNFNMTTDDFYTLVKKYQRFFYTVNFVAFVEDVEAKMMQLLGEGGIGQYLDNHEKRAFRTPPGQRADFIDPNSDLFKYRMFSHPILEKQFEETDLINLIRRIQIRTLVDGVSFDSLFKMLDKFVTGKVTINQFLQVLDYANIGVSGNNRLLVSEPLMAQLISLYRHELEPDKINWRRFHKDIESSQVLQSPHDKGKGAFERDVKDDMRRVFSLVKKADYEWDKTNIKNVQNLEEAMKKIRDKLKKEQGTLRNILRDMDLTDNSGYTSLPNFNKMAAKYLPDLTKQEIMAVRSLYMTEKGFDRRKFVFDILEDQDENKREWGMDTAPQVPALRPLPKEKIPPVFAEAMEKIKNAVITERTNLNEFFSQYDYDNSGRITQSQFWSALVSAKITDMTADEMELIFSYYSTPFNKQTIEYRRFNDNVESSIQQKDLEKQPLIIPVPRIGIRDGWHNFLFNKDRLALEELLDRLSGKADLLELDTFKEFDRFKRGTISKDRLLQVLTYLKRDCIALLTENDVNLLFKAFGKKIGSDIEMDYIQLLYLLKQIRKDVVNKSHPFQ